MTGALPASGRSAGRGAMAPPSPTSRRWRGKPPARSGRSASSPVGKILTRVQGAIHEIRRRLPMPLRGLDTDNGSEFINRPWLYYCYRTRLTFTRSRAYPKNDSAHVEQKNGAIVRALIGHDRFASKQAYAQFARVYRLRRLHINSFQPVQRLLAKTRHAAVVHRRL